jgi:hypothetical protein
MRTAFSYRAPVAVAWMCLGTVVFFGCSRKPKPGDWTGGYTRHETAAGMSVRFACKTWHEKEDTVSYAVFCQAETAGFRGVAGEGPRGSPCIVMVLAGESGTKDLHLPYVEGRQFWVKPNGRYEIIEKPWSVEELRTVSKLFGELPGIRFDGPDALREYIGKSLRRNSQASGEKAARAAG